MFRHWSLFAFAVAATLVGCSKAPEPSVSQPAATHTHDHEATATAAPPLSAEDQVLADKQKVCAVAGGPFGGDMGHPVKVMVGDRAVFLCCEHCRGPFEKDPQKYLAKLDAPAAAPGETAPEATTEAGTPAAPAPDAPAPEAPATPTTDGPAKPE